MAILSDLEDSGSVLNDLGGDYSWFWCDPAMWCVEGAWCGPIFVDDIDNTASELSDLAYASNTVTDLETGSNTLTDIESI
jgi:hypothetical protein